MNYHFVSYSSMSAPINFSTVSRPLLLSKETVGYCVVIAWATDQSSTCLVSLFFLYYIGTSFLLYNRDKWRLKFNVSHCSCFRH